MPSAVDFSARQPSDTHYKPRHAAPCRDGSPCFSARRLHDGGPCSAPAKLAIRRAEPAPCGHCVPPSPCIRTTSALSICAARMARNRGVLPRGCLRGCLCLGATLPLHSTLWPCRVHRSPSAMQDVLRPSALTHQRGRSSASEA